MAEDEIKLSEGADKFVATSADEEVEQDDDYDTEWEKVEPQIEELLMNLRENTEDHLVDDEHLFAFPAGEDLETIRNEGYAKVREAGVDIDDRGVITLKNGNRYILSFVAHKEGNVTAMLATY
ncbi:MAG: hypothetical protein Q7S37_03695 [bacterium]|nr:hypothetical protein [bacterium]